MDAYTTQIMYYLYKFGNSKFGKIIGFKKVLELIESYYFNKSLHNKKFNLKHELYGFTKNLYVYMTFKIIPDEERDLIDKYVIPETGITKHNLPKKGITLSEINEYEVKLYKQYLKFINRSLYLNKEDVSLDRLKYFLKIQLDLLNSSGITGLNPRSTFIYQDDIKHINKLKIILKLIYKYSTKDDYFTLEEFQEFIKNYRENFYIDDIDIFKNLNKIPKRLKKRKDI
jgi:hypothetical protein